MRAARSVFLVALFACLALFGCSSPPPPTVVQLTIKAGSALNPDASGRPSPVIVRVYQLGGAGAFEKADFFQLYEKDNAVLGADLVGRDQVALAPGDSKTLTLELKPTAKLLGIAAAFRDIGQADWRAVAKVTPNATTKLTVTIDKLAVKVAGGANS